MSTIEKALGNNRRQMPGPDAKPVGRAQSPWSRDERADIELPFNRLHELGYLTPAAPSSIAAEEFRAIKRPLLRNIAGRSGTSIGNANLIMVTSALQGDGKTFSSLNLAMSIAMEQDKTVLYIDADVHKGSAGKLIGIAAEKPGLMDILTGEAKPEDAILRTSMPALRIMPAGSYRGNATELLAGEKMHRLMEEFSSRYSDRVIVFDSPPLLLTNEASVLASFMGQIVFVAGADITPQQAVREALERIGRDKMVAVMLNKASRRRFNIFGGGYGYGYGGYGYGYGVQTKSDAGTMAEPSR